MRIAQFTSSLIEPLGGAEQYCLAIARHQKASGQDVTVVTGWADPAVVSALAADGIPTRIISTSRPYSPDRQGGSLGDKLKFHGAELLDSLHRTAAARELEAAGFDVVHIHRFAGFGTAILRIRGCRVVHTVHDYTLVDTSASLVADGRLRTYPPMLQRVRSAVATRGITDSPTLIFPTERTRDTHELFGLDLVKMDARVLPHGWPRPTSPAAPAHRASNDLGSCRVLFMGKLAEHKGISLLLDAWGSGIDGAELHIAGDGPMAEEVNSRVAGISSIHLLGWLDETERTRALATADILVFPSSWPENFPIVIAESMLAGVPVISTTTASPPLVDDADSGLLVAPSPSAVRAGIERLVADPDFRAALARGASSRGAQLDMDVHGDAIMAIYGTPGREKNTVIAVPLLRGTS